MSSASRLLEPGGGEKPAEKQSVKNSTHTWKPRPQYVGAIRVKHSHCRAALFTHHGQGCGPRMGLNILREMTRTKRLKDRYFDQQGMAGNTTANGACGQQSTRPADNSQRGLHAAPHYAYAERPDKSA